MTGLINSFHCTALERNGTIIEREKIYILEFWVTTAPLILAPAEGLVGPFGHK